MNDKDENNEEVQPVIPQALLDYVVANYKKPADLIGENGMLKQLTKVVIEAALKAQMNEHLGHTRYATVGNASGNVRNGQSTKTLSGEFGEIEIAVPRDRDASFSPQLIPKHQRRMPGFDERVLSLYARGLSTREIGAHLQEMFDVEVSPALISAITGAVALAVVAGSRVRGAGVRIVFAWASLPVRLGVVSTPPPGSWSFGPCLGRKLLWFARACISIASRETCSLDNNPLASARRTTSPNNPCTT